MIQRLAELLGFRRPVAATPEPIDDYSSAGDPVNGADDAAPVSPDGIAAAQAPERPVAPAPVSPDEIAAAQAPERPVAPAPEAPAEIAAAQAPERPVAPAPEAPAGIAAAQAPERPVAPAPEAPGQDDGGDEIADELELRDPFRDAVADALRTVYDPEIPTNIYELGLIYALKVDAEKNVQVEMTLTAPGCPVAGEMPGWVHDAVAGVEGAGRVKVELVWDPPWDPSRMSEIARLETGFDYY